VDIYWVWLGTNFVWNKQGLKADIDVKPITARTLLKIDYAN